MYNKLILTTALGLVMFSSDSLAVDCNLTYKLEGDSYVVTGASNKSDCTEANIPATYNGKPVTSIGNSAFERTRLTSIDIPNSVTSIGNSAFRITNLENVTIPDSVTSIGDRAFDTTKLTSIMIPDSVTNIGGLAFYATPTLTSIDIQGLNPTIDAGAFAGHDNGQIRLAGGATWSCGTDCTATLNNNGHVEFTGTGSMSGVANGLGGYVKSATISDGITSIGNSAFRITNLENVTIPDSVTSIGDRAFDTTKLTSIMIPDSVTNIGGLAFYVTPTLQEIFCSEASVESGKCASLASAGDANVSKINFGYYKDDAMNEERVFYLKDENGVWQEAKRESIYEKYVSDTGAVYLYDSKGNLKKMRGKKIYTVEEAMEATKNGNSFHVGLTYK